MSLVSIFEQMADQIREALANDVWDFQVEPSAITSPTLPCIDMYRGQVTGEDAAGFGATVEEINEGFVVVVRARVSINDNEGNQDVLQALADPTDDHCLVAAVYADATLDGWASDTHLLTDSGFTVVTSIDGLDRWYGTVWRFLVIPAVS